MSDEMILLQITVDPDLNQKLVDEAKRTHRSKTAMARWLLEQALKDQSDTCEEVSHD